jgi:hypothetical protein
MSRSLAALIAALLFLPAAALQEDPKGDKKEQEQKAEDEAKAALKTYRDKRQKAKKEEEVVDAILLLKDAKPHKLIRAELISILDSKLPPAIRVEAAGILGEYKKDTTACESLKGHARNERGSEFADLRRKCLRSFGHIAPFGKSADLQIFFSDPDNSVAREAIEAVESIRSVRMLKPLIDLLGELERIREDDGKDPGPGVPGGGGPQQGGNNNDEKRKRKQDLLEPTKKAINAIWSKHNGKKTLKNYTEARDAMSDAKAALHKLQADEDKEDAKP